MSMLPFSFTAMFRHINQYRRQISILKMTYCSECGVAVGPDANFCHMCGVRLRQPPPSVVLPLIFAVVGT